MTLNDFETCIHNVKANINVKQYKSKKDLKNDLKNNFSDQKHKEHYMVYALTFNDKAIVVGHGRYDRAQVIFDNYETYTLTHIKSTLIRMYHLAYKENEKDVYDNRINIYQRFIGFCGDKKLAEKIEKNMQAQYGGNQNEIPSELKNSILINTHNDKMARIILDLAFSSGYCGLSDLYKWRRKDNQLGIGDIVWNKIWDDLHLRPI